MNVTSCVKDVELVQVDMTALILSCVEPVANLASTYCRISPLVDREEFMQIGMLRVCERAPSVRPGAQAIEQLRFAASEAMLGELERLILYPTVSLEAYLASTPSDTFVTDPFSGTPLTLVGGDDIMLDSNDEDDCVACDDTFTDQKSEVLG